MSISIEITAEQIRERGVAEALAGLMHALGGGPVAAPAAAAPAAPAAAAPAVAAAAAAPAAAVAPAAAPAPKAKKRRGRPPKVKKEAPKAAKEAPKAAKEAPKAAPAAPEHGVTDLAGLMEHVSDSSRMFLKLLEEKQRLSMNEAMELLSLTEKKAVGGVVGGISRKAQKFDLVPPFFKGKDEDGERYWEWTGNVTEAAQAEAPKGKKAKSKGKAKTKTGKRRGRPPKKK